METHTIDYKKQCPNCGKRETNMFIHCDGFGFASTEWRCASCGKQYCISITITKHYFWPLSSFMEDERVEKIDGKTPVEWKKGM